MNEKKGQPYSGEIKASPKVQKAGAKIEFVTVTFRENRKFDLHIGREMTTFKGRQTKPIPATWLKHRDWLNVKNNFIVKGVKNA